MLCTGVLVVLLVAASGASAQAAFTARGSVEQVYVTGLSPSAEMALLDPSGKAIATQKADAEGGLLFRNVPPGSGYRVRATDGGATSSSSTWPSRRRSSTRR